MRHAIALGVSMVITACAGEIEPGASASGRPSTPAAPSTPGAPGPVAGNDCDPSPVGRVGLRRLGRLEFDLTVRDLLGDTSAPSRAFAAADELDVEGGFDNAAALQTVNTQHLTDWRFAAQSLAKVAVTNPAIMTCSPGATLSAATCARQILAPLARRAWRRAISVAELDSLVKTAGVPQAQGDPDPFRAGIALAIERLLRSPNFIFRPEPISDPASPLPLPLDAFAVASRLSYFVWRSMPDDALLAAAETGALLEPAELRRQVVRMLADAKAEAMLADLSRQWLLGNASELAQPDPLVYPTFDDGLRATLQAETRMLLQAHVAQNLPLSGLADADFTFANDRLARHYGLPAVTGPGFQRVSLAGDTRRAGVLAHGSLHLGTLTNPRVTSVQTRGVWVLSRLLCGHLGDPPPNATEVQDQIGGTLGPAATKRQLSEARIANPACGGCHRAFDPLGFALEGFDHAGAWRTVELGQPVTTHGELPGLGAFDGVPSLGRLLKSDPRLGQCVARTLATYGLGRVPNTDGDRCVIDRVAQSGGGAVDLVSALVSSPMFLLQRGEP